MEELRDLINTEGMNNNRLRLMLSEETNLPDDPELIKDLGEDLFKLARDSVEFKTRMYTHILASDCKLLGLMQAYTSCALEQKRQDPLVAQLNGLMKDYEEDIKEIKQTIRNQIMRGYDSSW